MKSVFFIKLEKSGKHKSQQIRSTSWNVLKLSSWYLPHSPRLFPAQYSLNSAESWPKTPFIHSLDICCIACSLISVSTNIAVESEFYKWYPTQEPSSENQITISYTTMYREQILHMQWNLLDLSCLGGCLFLKHIFPLSFKSVALWCDENLMEVISDHTLVVLYWSSLSCFQHYLHGAASANRSSGQKYQCTECGKALSSRKGLQYHMNQHLGIYPYYCPFCNKGLAGTSNLRIHMAEHVGRSGFFCLHCGQEEFPEFADFKAHLAVKHGMDSSHGQGMQTFAMLQQQQSSSSSSLSLSSLQLAGAGNRGDRGEEDGATEMASAEKQRNATVVLGDAP